MTPRMAAPLLQYTLTRRDMEKLKEASEMIRAAGEVFAQIRSPYQPALLKLLGDAADRVEEINGKAAASLIRVMIKRGLIPDPNAADIAQGAQVEAQATPTHEGARE